MSNYSPYMDANSLSGSPIRAYHPLSGSNSVWNNGTGAVDETSSNNSNNNSNNNNSPSPLSTNSKTATNAAVTPFQTYPKRDGINIDNSLPKSDMTGLDMSGFRIKRLPIELFRFGFLVELRLSNNFLTSLPAEIGLLRTLTSLDLSNNQLTALPRELSKLTNLTDLLVYNNQLTLLPAELGYLYQCQNLGIEGNPIMEPILSIMHSQGSAYIIPFLRDHMINTNPPMERFWHSLDQYNDLDSRNSFTLLTYNILAEKYATAQMYGYVPSWALLWEYRKQMILHEVLSYDADIICLQEVEANQFEQYFKTQLRMRGSYDGIFYPKSRAKTMNDWDRTFVDGCAIFFKSDRFKLEEKHLFEFNQVALARPSLRKHKDMYNRVMTRDNIAVACRLTHLESDQSILLGTVHIHWDPSHKDVKLVQTIMLIEEMERLLSKHPQSAMILCGDFNALQESGVGEFLENGSIGPGHEDFSSHTYEPYSTEGAHHTLNLKNSYGLLIEEPLTFTNFTPDFVGTIDYIWHRPSNLTVTGLLGSVPSDYSKQFVGFPTQHMPSDHIPLLVEYKIDGDAVNTKTNTFNTNTNTTTAYSNSTTSNSDYHLQQSSQSQSQNSNNSSSHGRRLYSRNKSAIS